MDNIYYEINIPNPNMEQVYDIVVQDADSIRKSLDGKKGIIKLYKGDNTTYGILNSATKLTKAEAVALGRSSAYQEPMPEEE